MTGFLSKKISPPLVTNGKDSKKDKKIGRCCWHYTRGKFRPFHGFVSRALYKTGMNQSKSDCLISDLPLRWHQPIVFLHRNFHFVTRAVKRVRGCVAIFIMVVVFPPGGGNIQDLGWGHLLKMRKNDRSKSCFFVVCLEDSAICYTNLKPWVLLHLQRGFDLQQKF